MDLGSIFLILAALILVALFVSRPWMENSSRESLTVEPADDCQARQRSERMAERDRVVDALRELDFDARLGKIPEDEYSVQRAALVQRGADLLRELDLLQGTDAVSESQSALPCSDLPLSTHTDDRLEEMIQMRRKQKNESVSGFCPRCGKPVLKSDRFCSKCGAAIS
ncbi:MAG: zinc ribbon domain-containing protein [Anaerolineaceae bacterium]